MIWRHSWVPGQFSFKYKIAYSTLVKNMNTRGQLVLKTGMATGRYVTVNASFCNLRQYRINPDYFDIDFLFEIPCENNITCL